MIISGIDICFVVHLNGSMAEAYFYLTMNSASFYVSNVILSQFIYMNR